MKTVTTMNKITEKLLNKTLDKIRPLVADMARSGMSAAKIAEHVECYKNTKIRAFLAQDESESLKISDISEGILKSLEGKRNDNKGNKTEYIFYDVLKRNEIDFYFQYNIGPYRVDYLIAGSIVFEGDGPHHLETKEYDAKRDQYLENMGYQVVRMPWDIAALVQDDLIKEIKMMVKAL